MAGVTVTVTVIWPSLNKSLTVLMDFKENDPFCIYTFLTQTVISASGSESIELFHM